MTNLQDQIKSRIQEARDKRIDSDAGAIAMGLGILKMCGTHVYKDAEFEIEYGFGTSGSGDEMGAWSHTHIDYLGTRVFEESGSTLKIFIPGAWEALFKALCEKADVVLEAKRKALQAARASAKAAEEMAERKRWGL